MFCYKCGARCSDRSTYCRKCNGPLLETKKDSSGKTVVDPQAIATYRARRKNPQISDLQPLFNGTDLQSVDATIKTLPDELSQSFYESCQSQVEQSYRREVEKNDAFYKPKIEAAKGRDRDQENEYYQGALASAKEARAVSSASLGTPARARKALQDMERFSLDAGVSIPSVDDSTQAHAFAQYVHKRRDRQKDTTQAAACFLVIGVILLIIGFLFFFLSFKMVEGSNTKQLVMSSFEFIVCIAGLGIGAVFSLYGLINIIVQAVKRHRYTNVLNYFGVYYRL